MEVLNLGQAIIFLAFLALFVYLGISYRTSDPDEFHTVHRGAGPLRVIASCFTVVGASEFAVFTSLAYLFGWASIWFFVGTGAGFLALALLAPYMRKRAAELQHHSIPDFAVSRGYPTVGLLLSFCGVAFTFALVLMQVIIGSDLMSRITGVPYYLCSAAICAAVACYLFFGGYRALLNTDVVQGFVLLVLTLTFAALLVPTDGLRAIMVGVTPGLELDVAIFALGGFFAIFGGPEIWQRILTASGDKSASTSSIISGTLMLAWGLALVVATLSIRATMPEEGEFLDFIVTIPPIALGFVSLMLIAALLSTADTELFTGVVILQRAWRREYALNIFTSRILIVAFILVAYLLSVRTPELVTVYLSLVYLTFIMGPTGFCLVMGRGNAWSLHAGVALAVLIWLVLTVTGSLVSWYPLLIIAPTLIPFLFSPEAQLVEQTEK